MSLKTKSVNIVCLNGFLFINNQNINWAHDRNITSFSSKAVHKGRIVVTKKNLLESRVKMF